jgi:hypothetical protein
LKKLYAIHAAKHNQRPLAAAWDLIRGFSDLLNPNSKSNPKTVKPTKLIKNFPK